METNRVALQTTKTKVTMELTKMRLIRLPSKRKKTEKKQTKWSLSKPKSTLKQRSSCDIMKGTPGPRFEVRFTKNELEALLLHVIGTKYSRKHQVKFVEDSI